MNIDFLKKNPIFWSRLGFCYDPPLKNAAGKPFAFTENFEKQISYHRDFNLAGVNLHTSVLHLGWMGVNEYDYSLTDRVLDAVFSSGDDVYYIPRIKVNVPIDWCFENPEEVFVYSDGPRTADEIKALVGTEKQDYLGYDTPDGYYKSGDFVDRRPNVGGVIARQSFSSRKWLKDAGEALSRLIDRLENGKYGNRILGYHIAYGTSGETILWGRTSKKYGDYGIANRREFYRFGIEKYGSREALSRAWCQPNVTEESLVIPSVEERIGKKDTLEGFFRANPEDKILIDYDLFTSEANVRAIEHFGKIVKEKTGKLVGSFYGYSVCIADSAYAGHLGLERLLSSPYVDFLAAPKVYRRSLAGEPGGEISPAQSINLSKIFLDELDNRTHVGVCKEDIEAGYVSKNLDETLTVMYREFSKDLSHDSGFWWMDLGGGWFDDKDLMDNIAKLVKLNRNLRKKEHKSVADMLIVYDERSIAATAISIDIHQGFLRTLINETNTSGIVADIYRAPDLPKISLSQYKLIVFAQNFYMSDETRKIIDSLPSDVTIAFSHAAGIWGDDGYSLENFEKITSHKIVGFDTSWEYDFPEISAERLPEGKKNRIVLTKPYMKADEIRRLAKAAGCHVYSEDDGMVIYGDNRFMGLFNKYPGGEVRLKEVGDYRDEISGEIFKNTDVIPLPEKEKSARLIIKI